MADKSNHFTSWIENDYGQIEFGRLDPDNVREAVYINNKQDPRHRFYMSIDRPQGNGTHSHTTLESPGGVVIKCGQDRERADLTFNIQVENGKLESLSVSFTFDATNLGVGKNTVSFNIAGSNP